MELQKYEHTWLQGFLKDLLDNVQRVSEEIQKSKIVKEELYQVIHTISLNS